MNSTNKVLFLGDSGVGKSTLINTLCATVQNNNAGQPQSTLGCSIQILAHQFQAGTPHERTELVELWDIGGSNAHREASRVFFDGASGVVFVHDLSNSRSEQNLAQWLELLNNQQRRQGHNNSSNFSLGRLLSSSSSSAVHSPAPFRERSYGMGGVGGSNFVALDLERTLLGAVPTLVVGTSLDQCPPRRVREHANAPVLRQFEHISLDARRPIQPGSTNRLVFSSFFDAVIHHSAQCQPGTGHSNSSTPLLLSAASSPRHRPMMKTGAVGKMQ